MRLKRKSLNTETVALANADYEERKASGEVDNMRRVEREWKLRAGQLTYYRANKNRRKDSGVETTFIR